MPQRIPQGIHASKKAREPVPMRTILKQAQAFPHTAGAWDRVQPYKPGQKLYRGVAIPLDPYHPLTAKIEKWLGDQDYDETYGQHLNVGPALLDHWQGIAGGM